MIQAELATGPKTRRLTLLGHATGEPAVCAAASALVFALAGWLQDQGAADLAFRLAPGDAWIQSGRSPLADGAFEMVATALGRLERSYPNHLALRTERRIP